MKAATIFQRAIGLLLLPLFVFCLSFPPRQAQAQDSDYEEPSEEYSREELAQMLAPIALYPDALLSQVLMASTYPIEVVEADRWVAKNPGLKGDDLDEALLDKDWDPSVKGICHFPSILELMSERITETTHLGNAFLDQEAEVMDMVQELRAKAYAQNNLTTDARQKVIVKNETIIIEPADPNAIYVSYYDPSYIYGPWWYPAYPPYYWGPPGISAGVGISYWPGFYFGFAFGTWSYFDWHSHYIHINVDRRPRYVRHDRWMSNPGRWHHAPGHRRGVAYRNKSTAIKYGAPPQRPRDFERDPRGIPEHRDPDRDRRMDDRNPVDQNQHRGWDPKEADRDRQKREGVEREKKTRERVSSDRQKQERIDRDKRGKDRSGIDPGKPVKDAKKIERDRQQRARVKQEKIDRERVAGDKQKQERIDRGKQAREKVERKQQQKRSDPVLKPVEDDRKKHPPGERGRSSQEPGPADNSRGKQGHSDNTEKDNSDNRGHNKR